MGGTGGPWTIVIITSQNSSAINMSTQRVTRLISISIAVVFRPIGIHFMLFYVNYMATILHLIFWALVNYIAALLICAYLYQDTII